MPQPVALTIPGQYWDVQLYRGVMYLFGRDAVVRVIDWDSLLASWDSDPRLRLALEMSFRESSLGYRLLLADPRLAADAELQSLMTSKFERLAALHLEVTQEQLEAFTLAISDSPFPFPHADTEIHYGWLMSGSDEGIHAAQLVTRGKTSRRRWISTELTQMWDLPTFGLAASHQSVAAALGDEGLVLLKLPDVDNDEDGEPDPIRGADGTFFVAANWIYASVLGTAQRGPGLMLRYGWPIDSVGRPIRTFLGVVPGKSLVGDSEYAWGNRDKLFAVSHGTVEALKFQPTEEVSGKIVLIGERSLPDIAQVVDAGTAIFGTVIQIDGGLLLVLTNGETLEIPEQPVRWRLYPRSTYYDNQMHIIFDSRLVVLSFNHDFFIDQASKAWGSRLDGRRLAPTLPR